MIWYDLVSITVHHGWLGGFITFRDCDIIVNGFVNSHFNRPVQGDCDRIIGELWFGLSNNIGDVIRFFDCLSDVLILDLCLGNVVAFGLVLGVGNGIGNRVTLCGGPRNINTGGFGKVLRGSVVSIGCLRHIHGNCDHLGVIKHLSFCQNPRFGIGRHGRVEDDSFGCHLGLRDVGVNGGGNCLCFGCVIHRGSLNVLCHRLPYFLRVAFGFRSAVTLRRRGSVGGGRGSSVGRLHLDESASLFGEGAPQHT